MFGTRAASAWWNRSGPRRANQSRDHGERHADGAADARPRSGPAERRRDSRPAARPWPRSEAALDSTVAGPASTVGDSTPVTDRTCQSATSSTGPIAWRSGRGRPRRLSASGWTRTSSGVPVTETRRVVSTRSFGTARPSVGAGASRRRVATPLVTIRPDRKIAIEIVAEVELAVQHADRGPGVEGLSSAGRQTRRRSSAGDRALVVIDGQRRSSS